MDVVINLALICKVNVTADSAGIADTDSRTHGNTAAEKKLIAYAFAEKLHSVIHDFASALTVSGRNALAVEEVNLNHIIIPVIENNVKEMLDIFSCFIIVNIKSLCAAPADAAYLRLAVFILDKPIGMLFC